MRSRLAIVLVLMLGLGTLASAPATAHGAEATLLAQEVGEETEEQGGAGEEGESQQGEQPGEGGEGQNDPETETDPGSGGGPTEEEGPPWTYQMSRLGVGLLLLVALGMGLMYWRLIVIRRREGY